MPDSPRSPASRVFSTLMACLAALFGFLAFNVVDGVFGFVESLAGLAACIAATVFVYRRPLPAEEDTNV